MAGGTAYLQGQRERSNTEAITTFATGLANYFKGKKQFENTQELSKIVEEGTYDMNTLNTFAQEHNMPVQDVITSVSKIREPMIEMEGNQFVKNLFTQFEESGASLTGEQIKNAAEGLSPQGVMKGWQSFSGYAQTVPGWKDRIGPMDIWTDVNGVMSKISVSREEGQKKIDDGTAWATKPEATPISKKQELQNKLTLEGAKSKGYYKIGQLETTTETINGKEYEVKRRVIGFNEDETPKLGKIVSKEVVQEKGVNINLGDILKKSATTDKANIQKPTWKTEVVKSAKNNAGDNWDLLEPNGRKIEIRKEADRQINEAYDGKAIFDIKNGVLGWYVDGKLKKRWVD